MSIFTAEMEAKIAARRAASESTHVPVMARFARAYPEHQKCPHCGLCDPDAAPLSDRDLCVYTTLADALTRRFSFDAHFAAYTGATAGTGAGRRLAGVGAFALEPRMVLFVVDVEPAGHAPVTPEWWADQERRLVALAQRYTGPHVYRTRGGYRIVWRLREPFVLRSPADATRWRHTYLGWLGQLAQEFGILGDTNCADWTRLYRLPFVVRDGKTQEPPAVLGSPQLVGEWQGPLAPPVIDVPREPVVLSVAAPVDDVSQLEAVEALAQAWPPPGTRHAATRALAGALAKGGWSADAAAVFMTAVSARAAELSGKGDLSGEYDKRHEFAERTVAMLQSGQNVEGWPTLLGMMPEAAITHARGKLGMSMTPEPELFEAMAPPIEVDPVLDLVKQRQVEPAPAPQNNDDLLVAALEAAGRMEAQGASEREVALLLEEISKEKRPPIKTYPTSIVELNARIGGGLKTRQLLVLAAPPGDGKSALAVGWCLYAEAVKERSQPTPAFPEGYPLGMPILYISTELEAEELLARFAANVLDRPDASWTKIVAGDVEQGVVDASIAGRRIRVIGSDRLPMDGTEALKLVIEQIARMKEIYGCAPMVVIDYLQDLVRHGGEDVDAKRLLGSLASKLRAIAQHFDCVLIAVSAVSRSYYGIKKQEEMRKAEDSRVYLAAAKESGDVDYAAATVIFLDVGVEQQAVEGQPPPQDGRPARIAIAKCRHGNPGFVGARFFGASGRWTSDPNALVEVIEASAAAGGARSEARAAKDAEAVVARVQALSSNPQTKTQIGEHMPGWGKPRGMSAVAKALELGLIVEEECTRIEGGRPKQRTCLFVAGAEPSKAPPQPVVPDPSIGGFLARLQGQQP